MYSTYLYFKGQIKQEYSEVSLEDLAELYRQTHDDAIIAVCFVKVYGISKRCLDRFYSLDGASRVELALEKIVSALENYSKGSRAKFTSYYYATLNRRAQDVVAKLCNSEDILLGCDSLDRLRDLGYDAEARDTHRLDNILAGKTLRESERRFCEYVMSDPHNLNVSEIAKGLGMSRQAVYNMIKRLREVFSEDYKKLF